MKLTLAENIRAFRKQRGLTQEQLAEVMGVTVGAVHKWETRLSTPELTLIAELADFFEVSTDTLLGFEMKDNRLKATSDRLGQYINAEDPEGMNEAERALKRFPNNFSVVYLSAVTYMMFGGKSRDERLLARAMELLERSLLLLPQNPNQAIGESSIYEYMANVQMMWGKGRQAADLLIAHNREGIFNHLIGLILSVMCQSPQEAQSYLSEALLSNLGKTVHTVLGMAYAFTETGDHVSAEKLLRWALDMLNRLQQPGSTGYPDQAVSFLYTLLSYVLLKQNRRRAAADTLRLALGRAQKFDAAPNYNASSFWFVRGCDNYFLHMILGHTVQDSVAYLVSLTGNEELLKLWKEITNHEA